MSNRADRIGEHHPPDLYARLVAQLHDRGVVLMDREGRITDSNPGMERLFGYTEAELVGQMGHILFTPEDRAAGIPEREMGVALERGQAADIRWHSRRDGSALFADGSLTAIKDDDGSLLGFAKVIRDATDRKLYEERLEQLTEGLNLAQTSIRRLDGTIEFWSEGCERIYGFRAEEAVGRFAHELLQTRFPEPPESIEEQLRASHIWRGELQQIRKDGSVVTVMSDWLLHSLRNGERVVVIEACTDITALKEAEAERERLVNELAQRAAELDAILASIPDALYIGDWNGITRVNQLALEQLGFATPEELRAAVPDLARRIQTRDPVSGQPLGGDEQPFARALQGETVAREVATTHLVTGEEVIVRCSARPIVQAGKIVGAVAINTDVTAERRNAAELERLLGALQRSNQQLADFAHVVSHDLQAPLRMIRSYAQLLERRYRGRLDEGADAYISTILAGAAGMEQLIQALLQYAQAGQDEPHRSSVPVDSVVDAVVRMLKPAMEETSATVTVGPLPLVEADRVQLQQLFQNLISNALKYRKPTEPPRIRIGAEERRDHSLLFVEDNGIGLSARDAERIFEPLRRLHGKEIPGVGIGLAVCRNIVERHGGRIWVESEPNQGSTFFFTIPNR